MRLTVKQVADILGVCVQRVLAKVRQGHFPSHGWCECGRSIMIPEEDIKPEDDRRKRKQNEGN